MSANPFDSLFAPMPAGWIREVIEPDVIRARQASNVLIMADYCASCGHRRSLHDGGLGSCRQDGCHCHNYFES